MTQEQLAHAAGVSRNQIQNIENSRNNARDENGKPKPGPANPRLDTLWSIAAVLDVEIADLVPRRTTGAAGR